MPTTERLFGYQHAFDHPVTLWLTVSIAAVLALSLPLIALLFRTGKIDEKLRDELVARCVSWMIIVPAVIVPLLLGAAWMILFIGLLSLLCYREFARATGQFRHREVSLIVVIGILAITFATLDHWYGFFAALPPLTIALLVSASILRDDPKGYIQRVALGIFAFLLFGVCLGHLGYFANDSHYRPMLFLILACVQLNDVFAFICGKLLGKHKLCPGTSPNKTIEGSLGAIILTTTLVTALGFSVFAGTKMATLPHLVGLGLIISITGQLGDLTLSSIKRDLSIKDMGHSIPGHGGLLDRCNSLLLVAPAAFHYIGFFIGIGLEDAKRIITGT